MCIYIYILHSVFGVGMKVLFAPAYASAPPNCPDRSRTDHARVCPITTVLSNLGWLSQDDGTEERPMGALLRHSAEQPRWPPLICQTFRCSDCLVYPNASRGILHSLFITAIQTRKLGSRLIHIQGLFQRCQSMFINKRWV